MANQRSTSTQVTDVTQYPSAKDADKLRKYVSNLIKLCQKLYPTRYIRLEPKPNVTQGPIIEDHVYRVMTCSKQSETCEDWKLAQEGTLLAIRNYLKHELAVGDVRKA